MQTLGLKLETLWNRELWSHDSSNNESKGAREKNKEKRKISRELEGNNQGSIYEFYLRLKTNNIHVFK